MPEQSPAAPPARSAWLDPKLLVPVIQAILLFALGYVFTQRVSLSLERRKLDLSAVRDMQSLVFDLQVLGESDSLDWAGAEAKAAGLALFGEFAVPAFVQLVEKPSPTVPAAALHGLRAVAQQNPGAVVRQLDRVLQNRNGVYGWQTHDAAVRILGEIDTPESIRALRTYRRQFPPGDASPDSLWHQTLRRMVRDEPAMRNAFDLRTHLSESLGGLEDRRPMYLRLEGGS